MVIRLLIVLALVASACSADGGTAATTSTTVGATDDQPPGTSGLVASSGDPIPQAPESPSGPLSQAALDLIAPVWGSFSTEVSVDEVVALGAAGDVRVTWLLSDLLRFFQGSAIGAAGVSAFTELTGVPLDVAPTESAWVAVTDLLIGWDLPAPPGYEIYKQQLFTIIEPGWEPFFTGATTDVDWRFVSWGGVRIDNRELGDTRPCSAGCIPALDDPGVTDADGGLWYPDDAVVFGVTVNGESRAYPKNIMEVHEMVNDTLGGRRIGMPYCTLCGSAQAFYTDTVPDGFATLVLRTSGLLARSNKVMYDLDNKSMFDTFLGVALTGPLAEAGFTLDQTTVVTTTWAEWKLEHPDTTIVAQDGGIGRFYPEDPLRGRDDNGPIFPVGDVDPRLPVQEPVVGVVNDDGSVVAFPAAAARAALASGEVVMASGVELVLDAGGLRAFGTAGELSTHESFWFAWSQFQPNTSVWSP